MSRFVDISPYEECRIVSNQEDNGFPVSELPTIDAVPVRHGHWILEPFTCNGDSLIRCSACKRAMIVGKQIGTIENFCPNCGAKMDEVSE